MTGVIDLGYIQIHLYSICIFIGILAGGKLAMIEAQRWNIPKEFIFNLIFWMVIFGIIGARIYYVLFNLNYYSNNIKEIFMIWHGGLAIHGGIITAIIFLIYYAKKYKLKLINLLDILAPGLLLGQAIGRWGNFFNGEAHGPVTTLMHLENLHLPDFIINGMYINGNYYIPAFLYESIWCLLGVIILLFFRRRHYCKIGEPLSFYLIWYGIGRFFIESMRTDSLMFASFKIAQIISLIMIIVGVILIIKFRKGSKFDNLYNDEENWNEIKF